MAFKKENFDIPGLIQALVPLISVGASDDPGSMAASIQAGMEFAQKQQNVQAQSKAKKQYEQAAMLPGVKTSVSQSPTGFTTTLSAQQNQPLFVYDQATGTFSSAGNIPQGSRIIQQKSQKPQQVFSADPNGGLKPLGTVPQGSKVVKEPKPDPKGISAFSETELINIVQGGGFDNSYKSVAKKELAKRLGIPESEVKKPWFDNFLNKSQAMVASTSEATTQQPQAQGRIQMVKPDGTLVMVSQESSQLALQKGYKRA